MATALRPRRRRPSAPAERLIAEVLKAQGEFFRAAKRPSEEFLRQAIVLPPGFDPLDAETIREAQMAYQQQFQQRSAERLRLGVRQAMAQPTRLGLIRRLRAQQRASDDPDVKVRLEGQIEKVRGEPDPRREAVVKVLETERRLARAHAAAMVGRARGATQATVVRSASPSGAYWHRDPTSNSCEECIFLDGRLIPWEVLDTIGPPRHPNCRCTLIPIGDARRQGLVGTQRMPTVKQSVQRLRRVLRESIEGAILVEAIDRGLYREIEHRRDPFGRWTDMPAVSVGRVARRPVETRIAGGYADAAQTMAQGFEEAIDRDVSEAMRRLPVEFLTTRATGTSGIEEEFSHGRVRINRYGWDTGETMFNVEMPGSDQRPSRMRRLGDPDLRGALEDDLRAMADAAKAPLLERSRKNLRGAILSPTTPDGRKVYGALGAAQVENNGEPDYADLRERWAHVPERLVVVDEKGYGQTMLGINDVFVTASRHPELNTTAINALAIKVAVDNREIFGEGGVGSRPNQLHPGTEHLTVRSTAALLRHEWGHGMYEAMTPEQREEFRSRIPDWDVIAEGLSKYAAGTPESRADYDRRSFDYGYETETFAEMVALVGGSDYVPEQWPEWVQELGEWIWRLEP
jgi:hypothetical protein